VNNFDRFSDGYGEAEAGPWQAFAPAIAEIAGIGL
jgi:hypothetical protein